MDNIQELIGLCQRDANDLPSCPHFVMSWRQWRSSERRGPMLRLLAPESSSLHLRRGTSTATSGGMFCFSTSTSSLCSLGTNATARRARRSSRTRTMESPVAEEDLPPMVTQWGVRMVWHHGVWRYIDEGEQSDDAAFSPTRIDVLALLSPISRKLLLNRQRTMPRRLRL